MSFYEMPSKSIAGVQDRSATNNSTAAGIVSKQPCHASGTSASTVCWPDLLRSLSWLLCHFHLAEMPAISSNLFRIRKDLLLQFSSTGWTLTKWMKTKNCPSNLESNSSRWHSYWGDCGGLQHFPILKGCRKGGSSHTDYSLPCD